MSTNSQWITAQEYTECLIEIGEKFLHYFHKRRNSLPLHIQIACGMLSLSELKEMLLAKPHLANVRDDFGRTPMMVYWHSILYSLLLEHGANTNQCDNDGNTVLMYHRKNTEMVELLLSYGADINAKNNEGISLIAMAQREGLPIQPLLDAGAIWQPVTRDKKNEIFLNCLPNESIEVLSRIVSDNVISEETYHHARVWSGCHCQKKFEWLRQHENSFTYPKEKDFTEEEAKIFEKEFRLRKCDVESEGFKTLLNNMKECLWDLSALNKYLVRDPAVLSGVSNVEILEILLKAGADPNLGMEWEKNTDAGSILYSAVELRNAKAVRLLLAAGANPTSGTSYMECDDTNVACAIRNNDLDILKMLIEAKADLDFAIRCNRTPIITAIKENNLPALKMLIEAGANPNLADLYGRIPAESLDKVNNSPELIDYFMTVTAS